MKITLDELNKRQGYNLDQKIDHAIGVIEQFYNYTGGCMVVMFSGGKDSTVLLHLVRMIYPNIKAVFVNTTNEFSEILQFVKSNAINDNSIQISFYLCPGSPLNSKSSSCLFSSQTIHL